MMRHYKNIEIGIPNSSQDLRGWIKIRMPEIDVPSYDFIKFNKYNEENPNEEYLNVELNIFKLQIELKMAVLDVLKSSEEWIKALPQIKYLKPNDLSIISYGD